MKPMFHSAADKRRFPRTDYFFHSGTGGWRGIRPHLMGRTDRNFGLLQFESRIHDRIDARTGQRNGGIWRGGRGVSLAGDLHGDHRREIADKGRPLAESWSI